MQRKHLLVVLSVLATLSTGAHATSTLDDLLTVVSFVDVVAAIMSIGALIIGVDLAQLGYMKVRRLVKGGH